MRQNIYFKVKKNSDDKEWLMMVHGFTQNHKVFNKQVEEFKKDYNLLMIDLRGHGKSKDGLGSYGIEEYADDIQDVLMELQLEDLHYWGTHTGTAIGLVLYFRNSSLIKSLILEGTVLPGYEMPKVTQLIERAKRISKEKGIEVAREDWFNHAEWFKNINENYDDCRGKEHYKLIKEFRGEPWIIESVSRKVMDVRSRLSDIIIPIMIYNGEYEMEIFKEVADEVENNVKNITRIIISEAGGFPCWEKPMAVNKEVKEFLSSQ
ncbi:MAG: alpha/beta hydrolase [Vallitaleaceae bacterium]|jgi:pimeloyl-ACP methyl ester carboxylesterase|nr:alpha/beta hydrolase [Vallitaleaceae bacterium]